MRRLHRHLFGLLLLAPLGCVAGRPSLEVTQQAGGSAALFHQFAAYDGRTGGGLAFAEVVRRCAQADVVLFGEEHNNAVCNQLQAQLLDALIANAGPTALAMEFFEADTQATVDAYLDGKLAEPEFQSAGRQGRLYWTTHRPLVERCRAAGAPVLAANVPRRLVRAFRVSELEYDAFLATVGPEDRRWLPARSTRIGGSYEQRFFELMGGHDSDPSVADDPGPATARANMPTTVPTTGVAAPATQPAETEPPAPGSSVERFYRAQLLWDDAMAESVANYRRRHPRDRVVLVVGSFHVAHEGGTFVKVRERRPRDGICSVVFVGTQDGHFPLREADRGAGDVVLYGITPPPPGDGS